MTDAVAIFLRRPVPGEVKTRLAADIGPDHAARLYREWVVGAFSAAAELRPRPTIVGYHTGGASAEELAALGAADVWKPQPDGDLGARLAAVFEELLPRHRKVLAIGTDCPDLRTDHLEVASQLLNGSHTVLGPATDGGYYLVGLRSDVPRPGALFTGVRWSSEWTFLDQIDKFTAAGLQVGILSELSDIDTAEDLRRWQASRA